MAQTGGSYLLFNMRARGDWVRLRTLMLLRWMAVAGQAAAVLFVSQGLGFDLPLPRCALLISASVTVNVAMFLIYPAEKRLGERGTLASLFFDLAQLVGLLMLTGGLNNPFILLVMAPVAISATALRLQSTLLLGLAAICSIPLMKFYHVPLVGPTGEVMEVPGLYGIGSTAALAIGIVFLALYVRRVTVEGYRMSQALNATQVALGREQRLAAIGGIAAATAHELGTPLATIKLVAGELARELKDHPDLPDEIREDVELIRTEADRCRDIMADIGQGGRDDTHVKTAPVSAVIEEAARPHMNRGKQIVIRFHGHPVEDATDLPMMARAPELIHGLRNVIQNAVDFSKSTVWVDMNLSETSFRIAVGDDGPGFSQDILPRLGEPYVSTRPRETKRQELDGYEGMGLGLFIARTLLERTGAKITYTNGSDPMQRRVESDPRANRAVVTARPPGAIIELVWPVASVIRGKADTRLPLGPNLRFDPVQSGQ